MHIPDFFNCEDHLIVVKVNGINGFMEENGDRLHFPAALQTINLGLTADFVGALNANDAVNAGDSDKERLNEARAALAEVYRFLFPLYNYWYPSFRLIGKVKRADGRYKKVYKKRPKTPCERLLESADIVYAQEVSCQEAV
jgi:hypothetical protein